MYLNAEERPPMAEVLDRLWTADIGDTSVGDMDKGLVRGTITGFSLTSLQANAHLVLEMLHRMNYVCPATSCCNMHPGLGAIKVALEHLETQGCRTLLEPQMASQCSACGWFVEAEAANGRPQQENCSCCGVHMRTSALRL